MPAFEFNDANEIDKAYEKVNCHVIFDVKMIGLVRKAQLVTDGHRTEEPKESTYSSVVSCDSVRLAFLLAALNGLNILTADVQNAYLHAKTKERYYTIAGPEFGLENVGRPMKIVRALYGLKSSGACWRNDMAETLRKAQFVSCIADPDVWMRPAVKINGDKYYEYVLMYVDDVLALSETPKLITCYQATIHQSSNGLSLLTYM
jgi:Reverse transcriptase (RNA-dependent DNA polymerase)